MNCAPVVIPTLCRYEHFRQCLTSLSQCVLANNTDVFVALDYPLKESHRDGYKKIKKFLVSVGNFGFKNLYILERKHNYGVEGNASDLKKYVMSQYDAIIYSEDDNVFAPNFLVYMNSCLDKYKDDMDVVSVCGYSYPISWDISKDATVFKQQFNVAMWGTGLWTHKERVFEKFCYGNKILLSISETIREKKYLKMVDASLREYFLAACRTLKIGKDMMSMPTDISRRAYLAVADKYAITPVISKVRNLGFDGSGVYCQVTESDVCGDTAGTYNYSQQPIDSSQTFTLVEDTLNHAEENRKRLNKFDYRSPKQMAKAYKLLWLCEHVGIWSARLYCLAGLPFDIVNRAYHKLLRSWGKK